MVHWFHLRKRWRVFPRLMQGCLVEFSQVKPTTCLLDPIPTPFLKTLDKFIEEQLLYMVNCSLQTTSFKTAVLRPLLKNNNLDSAVLTTIILCPSFLRKDKKKLVFNQVNDFFLNASNIFFEKYQSGLRINHSTETALLKILNGIRCNLDNHKLTVFGASGSNCHLWHSRPSHFIKQIEQQGQPLWHCL